MSTLSAKLTAAAKSYLQRYGLKHFVGESAVSTLARGLVDKDGNVVMEADGATPAVTLGGSQTLTNKLLTAASNFFADGTTPTKKVGFSVSGASSSTTTTIAAAQTGNRTLTLPDATDTLVGRATTDTLTNKTLTSPVIGTSLSLPTVGTPVAAAGSSTSDAAALTAASIQTVSSDSTAKGVKLPTGTAGLELRIFNTTSTACKIYPDSGGTINGGSANANVNIPASTGVLAVCTAASTWTMYNLGTKST